MWCTNCKRETNEEICEICGCLTERDVPLEIYWCKKCQIPIIKLVNAIDREICPLCGGELSYCFTDIRPVFPEERLLIEIILGKPLAFLEDSVWASKNRYYVDGKSILISTKQFSQLPLAQIRDCLHRYKDQNNYTFFDMTIKKFVQANSERLNTIINEAHTFVKNTAASYPRENIVVSFSGGKDSTVTADLAMKALSDPSLVHIFGDTTLEFPSTLSYVERYRTENCKAILKTAKNTEMDFLKVCEDIGPPARLLRWCCSMFKTGPITRVLNSMYNESSILTFYGIRKCESVSRSKYNRIEDSADAVKIQKQKVASPIFLWKDIDVWLYILGQKIDFNEAYKLGYDRVGCWCCPNNSERAQFLTQIYMPKLYAQWHDFLVSFAKKIGKPDPEEYINTGKWKARQGGNGLESAHDVKLHFVGCTTEDNAKVYRLNKPISENFIELFIPFGRIAPELGRKMISETIIVDSKTNTPIISIQPFEQERYDYSVKVKTMNVLKHNDLHRMIGYQIRKYNACRCCLKCESLCKYGAISISNGTYHIDASKCTRCKKCVTAKYLREGCLMGKYLRTKE